MTVATVTERRRLERAARGLAWLTIAWNVIEAVVAIGAGLAADSIALVGFGFDSTIEVLAACVVLWRFRSDDEARERQALRLIGVTFFALAAYVSVEAIRDLVAGGEAETSTVGIGLAIASAVVMPLLAWAKRRVGRRLGSSVVVADSTQTLLCTYLSFILLAGLVLNATVGLGWADPVAALGIAVLAAREGREAWRGDDCC
jgi:divalent metal cation (Fe/Co/Zn/Cd) transporter